MKQRETSAAVEETIPERAADPLTKIYVEPTNRCNLCCLTCIRHSWDESFEDIAWSVYQTLIDGLADFPDVKTIAFSGFGEPLLHPRFPEMVRLAHINGLRTEMTSNAMLLISSLAERLIDAGLDQFTVSIDGTSNESHGTVRPGASLEEIMDNVRRLHSWSQTKCITQLDIEMPLKKEMLRHLKDSASSIYGLLDMISYKVPIEGALDPGAVGTAENRNRVCGDEKQHPRIARPAKNRQAYSGVFYSCFECSAIYPGASGRDSLQPGANQLRRSRGQSQSALDSSQDGLELGDAEIDINHCESAG